MSENKEMVNKKERKKSKVYQKDKGAQKLTEELSACRQNCCG